MFTLFRKFDFIRRKKIEDTVVEMLGEYPEIGVKNKLESSLNKMSDEIKTMNSDMKKLEMELHSLTTKRTSLRSVCSAVELLSRTYLRTCSYYLTLLIPTYF